MAAGLGFKDFTTGEVLTAADVDGYLMQGIWVFASAAARDAAVTSPQEGNACYLKDTNQVLTYSGSAWVAVGGGSPLTTKGDLYGFNTVDARIPIGANDTVLTADSTQSLGLKWAAPTGAATSYTNLANATSVGTSTTVTFSGLSGYNKLLIMMRYISGDTASASLQMRLNADTGANYNNFNNQNRANSSYSTNIWTNDVTLNDTLTTLGTTGTNTGSNYVGYIAIDGANSTNHKMLTYGLGIDSNTGNGALFSATGATFYKGSSVISSLTLLLSSGNFDGGTVYIYGGN